MNDYQHRTVGEVGRISQLAIDAKTITPWSTTKLMRLPHVLSISPVINAVR